MDPVKAGPAEGSVTKSWTAVSRGEKHTAPASKAIGSQNNGGVVVAEASLCGTPDDAGMQPIPASGGGESCLPWSTGSLRATQ
jgi:hypothetical protein